ncbi:MAG: dihydroorotase [Alphaproteobacteria bacterium]|nr:dihydroorotase [Alphaproteobacteria bacterium]
MADKFDLIVRGGTCLTPGGPREFDVGIANGRFVRFGDLSAKSGADADQVIEATGLHVLPGVIDSQVHFREPGFPQKEDLESGTRAAVAGGVTSVFEMPNTDPATVDETTFRDKMDRAEGRAWCDYAFFVGAAIYNVDHLAGLERAPGCCGVKVFMGSSTGGLLVADDATLTAVLAAGRRRAAIHSEDELRLRQRREIAQESGKVHDHPNWRDVETALSATRRLLAIAHATGREVHVLHVTTAEEMELLARHRHLSSVEVTPQHLTLHAPDCYDKLGTLAQMNPPIRDKNHRDALWMALDQGLVDVIGSDHAPHTLEEKGGNYPDTPSGMPGVQTLVPVMLNHVAQGKLSLERFVDLTAAGPARLYGVAGKGRLSLGYDADLTIVDLAAKRTITNDWIKSTCGWTPFDGMQVTGWPIATVIRGEPVMRDDEILGAPTGNAVRFQDTLRGETSFEL